ncbi:glycosyltransferase family 2 protein [Paucibacter sp. XJ19-41]|uniref:glycosyltransferase family 2 protein n=1 Tax=Paucibacter sp. XJ19-41 TaxID=2927824 RepID=UPI002349FA9C|nr:glycosyltransferase family 2 protein [Paucibacter sp. XJ19-41]MDC6166110.1 glycosyltransferase family 2 protein [Paucibacter sp. XJ19-41]
MITVVIPYFQRSPGVLRRALASIAAQQACPLPIHILVVDDASPVPADDEITAATLPDDIGMTLIRQTNGGPGAARNTGLDALPESTRYVAFLDSDDEWSPDHLVRAALALDSGFDFYFADHYQLDTQVSAFARAGKLKAGEHPTLPLAAANLHAYRGDMVDQIMRGNVIGTSTVVYRRAGFSELRFRIDYTSAGEDYLFWLGLVRAGSRIAFSSQVEATYGRGVNVYSGAVWGSAEHMLRVHNELKYRKLLLREFCRNAEQEAFLRVAVHQLRRDFIRDLTHRLKHRKPLPRALLGRYFRDDPATLWLAPLLLLEILRGQP